MTMNSYIGQYRVYTWEAIMIALAGGLSSLALATLLIAYKLGYAKFLHRHPGPMLVRKCCCELVFSVQCIFVPVWNRTTLYKWNDAETVALHATVETRLLAALTQWSWIATEMWFFAMSMDLLSSISNPFSSYTAHRKFYSRMSFGTATAMALGLLFLDNTNIGITYFYATWVVRKCTFTTTGCDSSTTATGLSWIFFYNWIIVIYAYSLFAWVYARGRLQAGIESTLIQRKSTLIRSGLNLMAWYFYWLVPFFLILTSWFSGTTNEEDDENSPGHWLGFFLAMVLSLRGMYTCLVILYIDGKDIFRSRREMARSMEIEDVSFSPHLNSALRSEILHYATLCIRTAVLRQNELLGCDGEPVNSPLAPGDIGASSGGEDSIQMTTPSSTGSTYRGDSMASYFGGRRGSQRWSVIDLLFPADPPSPSEYFEYEVERDHANEMAEHPLRSHFYQQQEEATRESRELARHTLHEVLDLPEEQEEAEESGAAVDFDHAVRELEDGKRDEDPQRALTNLSSDIPMPGPRTRFKDTSVATTSIEADRWRHSDTAAAESAEMCDIKFAQRVTMSRKPINFGPSSVFEWLIPRGDSLRFVDYKPETFRRIREISGLDPVEFARSWTSTTRESFSEGASGAFLFFSQDQKYMVKTTTRTEMRQLESIAEEYLAHLATNPESRLLRIYGAHSMEIYGQTLFFLVMNNIFPPEVPLQERYDLKGSWVNRQSGGMWSKPGKVLKDLDLNYMFQTSPTVGRELARQLEQDAVFLASKNLMDYSLLVGVVHAHYDVEPDPNADPEDPYARNVTGGLTAARVVGPAVFYVGIIDILQAWNFSKQLERYAKVIFRCADGRGLSAVPTAEYKRRFMERAVYDVFVGAATENEDANSSDGRPTVHNNLRATLHEGSSERRTVEARRSSTLPQSSSRLRTNNSSLHSGSSSGSSGNNNSTSGPNRSFRQSTADSRTESLWSMPFAGTPPHGGNFKKDQSSKEGQSDHQPGL